MCARSEILMCQIHESEWMSAFKTEAQVHYFVKIPEH